MAQSRIDIDRPERELNRTELTLGQIATAWRFEPRGQAFVGALLDFMRSIGTSDTLRSYSFSILQFWSWYNQENSKLPTPEQVTRADAVDFDRWLRSHVAPLTKWRLEHDPSRHLDLAIYQYVQGNPAADIESIRQHLGGFREFTRYHEGKRYLTIEVPPHPGGLARHLGCLVKLRTLSRTPTMDQLRREAGRLIFSAPENVFRYSVPVVDTPEGAERASTIATRLSALSSLWSYMIRSGENIAGRTEPLLRYNIWTEPLKTAQAQAPSHREVTRARKTPNLQLYLRILATTFLRSHGRVGAYAAAEAVFWGRQPPLPVRNVTTSFKDLRDRALLLLMAQTGLRSREIHRLKRNSLAAGDPPVLTVIGKRGKKRSIGLPPVVGVAIGELDEKIRFMAEHQRRYGYADRANTLLTESAPLLPAVSYWGANAGQAEQGLTRPGIAQVLRRRAEKAGIEPGSAEFARAHPHGLRHLYAKIALETTPPHRVRAIMGHASLATTGRYAEERRPEMLVAEAFKGTPEPPLAPAVVPALPPEPVIIGADPEAGQVAVRAPAPPRTAPQQRPAPDRPEPPVAPPAEREPAIVRRAVERIAEPPAVAKPRSTRPAPLARGFDAFVAKIVGYRKQAREGELTERQVSELATCSAMGDVSLRNLCVIYAIQWGEEKNREQLVSTHGGRKKKETTKKGQERVQIVDEFEPNAEFDEDDEDEFDEEEFETFSSEDIDIEAELAAMEESGESPTEAVARIERFERGVTLYSEAGTDKVARVYSGKDSGISWWTGTNGKLKPAMPVMSPAQVGECQPGNEGAVCAGLVELWRKWSRESPTKAEALVAWIGESLDLSAQMEAIVLGRGGKWVPSDTPWIDTKVLGTKRDPDPRLTFREHLPSALVSWFEARGGSYRVSTGDPAAWKSKTSKPKPVGTPPTEWFFDDDPITSLPPDERREMIDWILSLTGKLPVDTELRFGLKSATASRADVAEFVNALCQFDQSIDALRDSAEYGPGYVARLWKKKSVDEFPEKVRRGFEQLQSRARDSVRRVTMGQVSDFDAFSTIRRRVKKTKTQLEKKPRAEVATKRIDIEQVRIEAPTETEHKSAEEAELEALIAEQKRERRRFIPNVGIRESWALRLVRKYFGAEAATDPAIKLVAKCGRVPLVEFRELFNIERGTIEHSDEFKREFARRHGTHSECVARRIARKLWEIRQKRAKPKEAIKKPQHMVGLVEIMEAFKVPCTHSQDEELRHLAKYADEPFDIYNKWARLRTASTEQALTEAEQIQRDITEEFADEIAREERIAKFSKNPRRAQFPTPVHLTCAVMV